MTAALHRCQGCARDLDFNSTIAPRLGLVAVVCQRCQHRHLFSASELSTARHQLAQTAQKRGLPHQGYQIAAAGQAMSRLVLRVKVSSALPSK